MEPELFPSPVLVRFGKIGLIHTVTTVQEAAKMLRDYRWPSQGQVNLQARLACLEAAEGTGTCHDAMAAFVEAARDAGILLEED
jgi:hypothetical protein